MGPDVIHHVYLTVAIHNELRNILLSDGNVLQKIQGMTSLFTKSMPSFTFTKYDLLWPRLIHFIAASAAFMSRDILFCIRYFNIIYFILLIISVYLIGVKISNPITGLLSSCVVSFYPAIFGLSRKFGLDFPAIAVVNLIIMLLIYENFKSRFYSILFGILIGTATLIKGQCLFFITGPLLYVIITKILSKKERSRYILNIICSLILAILVSMVWWHKFFLEGGLDYVRTHCIESYSPFLKHYGSIPTYYLVSICQHISLIFSVLFLMGLIFYLRMLNKKEFIIIILCLFVPFVIFSFFIYVVMAKFIFPALGAIALISVVGLINGPKRNYMRKGFLLFTVFSIILGLYQFYDVTYGYKTSSEYSHPCTFNNHRAVMGKFNKMLCNLKYSKKKIAVLETPYFRGDFCLRLATYLKVLNNDNEIDLSAKAVWNGYVADDFLYSIDTFDFLVAFSPFEAALNFSDITGMSLPYQQESIKAAIKEFKTYHVVQTDMLQPEMLYIFLLKKDKK